MRCAGQKRQMPRPFKLRERPRIQVTGRLTFPQRPVLLSGGGGGVARPRLGGSGSAERALRAGTLAAPLCPPPGLPLSPSCPEPCCGLSPVLLEGQHWRTRTARRSAKELQLAGPALDSSGVRGEGGEALSFPGACMPVQSGPSKGAQQGGREGRFRRLQCFALPSRASPRTRRRAGQPPRPACPGTSAAAAAGGETKASARAGRLPLVGAASSPPAAAAGRRRSVRSGGAASRRRMKALLLPLLLAALLCVGGGEARSLARARQPPGGMRVPRRGGQVPVPGGAETAGGGGAEARGAAEFGGAAASCSAPPPTPRMSRARLRGRPACGGEGATPARAHPAEGRLSRQGRAEGGTAGQRAR